MTTTEQDPALEEARREYYALLGGFSSVQLATVSTEGQPDASYSPAVVDDAGNFFVYVSELASHTRNLRETPRASVMIIEDEATCGQIFARKRVTFACESELIERRSDQWEDLIARFEEKFGKLMSHLKTMADFSLYRLTPLKGRLVFGFGKAFEVGGPNMGEIGYIRGTGSGHTKEENA
ncbi:MAG: HugZ family protein [Opitutales bacterium]